MSNTTFVSLKLIFLFMIAGIIWIAYQFVAQTFFGHMLPDWFVFGDAIPGMMTLYTGIIILSQGISTILSIVYAFVTEGANWKGFLWATAFAGLNISAVSVWIAMDNNILFGVEFAVIVLTVVSLMNCFNFMAFIATPFRSQTMIEDIEENTATKDGAIGQIN